MPQDTGYKKVPFTLVKGADYNPVYDAIYTIHTLNREEYENFSKIDQALQNVVVNDPNRKQKEIEKDAQRIRQAVSGLKKKTKLKLIKMEKNSSQNLIFQKLILIGIFLFVYAIFVSRRKEKMESKKTKYN